MQHLKQGTGKPEKKAPATITRSAEFTDARYEDVIRTDTQCIFPPPSPKLQCWFSSVSRLPSTLNSRGEGFVNLDVRYLVLKQWGLFFRVYRSQVCVFAGILSAAHHLWLLTCSSLSSAYAYVMHVRVVVYVALPARKQWCCASSQSCHEGRRPSWTSSCGQRPAVFAHVRS